MVKMDRERDVVVIGGGPAGLATAIASSRKGFRPLVVEQARSPIDKACGEGLMPDGVAALSALGVTIPSGQSVAFRGIRFIQEDASVEAFFPNGCGLGIRRPVLHEVLIRSAEDAGIEILWDTKVTGIQPGEVSLGGSRIRCRWVIGADGQSSSVRRRAGMDNSRILQGRVGFRQHFMVAPWTDLVEVYWGTHCQVVITPVGTNLVCAALTSNEPRLRPVDAIASMPALSRRLENAQPAAREKGGLSIHRILRSVARGPFALIGDASGSVDTLTGEGLGLAFRQALFLADALAKEDLSLYSDAHRQCARMATLMSRLLLILVRHETLRRKLLRAFERTPRLFSSLLEAHVGLWSAAACRRF